jgi:hypothetical protein
MRIGCIDDDPGLSADYKCRLDFSALGSSSGWNNGCNAARPNCCAARPTTVQAVAGLMTKATESRAAAGGLRDRHPTRGSTGGLRGLLRLPGIHRAPNRHHPRSIEHVGVDHRRRHIGMSQQFLHRADVVAGLQQVRRE